MLAWIDERVGAKPYGVDVIVPATYVGRDEGGLSKEGAAALIPRVAAALSAPALNVFFFM